MLASTALDRCERTLSFDRSTIGIAGLESTNLLTVLNAAVKEWFASFEKSGEPPSKVQLETGYTLVSETAINNAAGVLSGATSMILDDTSEFGASGAVAIWDNERPDFALFGANNLTTTLSTVTLVSFDHEDNDEVSLLYALPSGYDSMRSEIGYEDGVSVDGQPFFFTTGVPVGNHYAIYDTGTTKYLVFPLGRTGDVFVRYNGVPTVVDAESDTVDIPTKDEDYAVWALVKYAAPLLERTDMYQIASAEMLKILSSAHIRKNIGKRPHLRPMKTSRSISYLYE